MALREPRFKGMVDLVTRRVEPSLLTLATIGFELAHSYLQLHAKGLCYRDISFGNVFFDADTGEVRICDNDNVDIDGQPGAIGGTARFMAPELVRGEAAPSTQTDLFSLAVLLFYLLMNHHPLEGAKEAAIRCFDLPAMTKLYGTEPLFIFDPYDGSNRPMPGFHDNALAFWPIYPEFLHKLFTRAFTDGLRDPANGRVRESEWRAASRPSARCHLLLSHLPGRELLRRRNHPRQRSTGHRRRVLVMWQTRATAPAPALYAWRQSNRRRPAPRQQALSAPCGSRPAL